MDAVANAREPSAVSASDQIRHCHHRRAPVSRLGSKDSDVYTAGRAEMSTYTVFIEPTPTGYSAYVPDLPGCVAAASSLEETRQLIKEAIEFHIEGMRMNGEVIPEPTRLVEQVEVSV